MEQLISFIDSNSDSLGFQVALYLSQMSCVWAILQLIVFYIPMRRSFDCNGLSMFALSKMPTSYKDTCNRIVCIIHEVFCGVAGAIYYSTSDNWNMTCGQTTTQLEYYIVIVSTAFFINDLCSK